jgi:lysophospholipase L1-like esterase
MAMSMRPVLRESAKVLLAAFFVLIICETLLRGVYFVRNSLVTEVPLPYMLGDYYGPVPPWLDGLRILEPDDALLWKSRSSLRRTYVDIFSPVNSDAERTAFLRQFRPVMPLSLRENPRWEISLNSMGFRDEEFSVTKPPSSFRIVCIGDSWTFGANVGQVQSYPQRLKALLDQELPLANFEILNLGVLGYSSYQGLELLRSRVMGLLPDLVVIGFGMNDASMPGCRDKDVPAYNRPRTFTNWLKRVQDQCELFKLLKYIALILKDKPVSIAEYISAGVKYSAEPQSFNCFSREGLMTISDYVKNDAWTRVSPMDYESNIREMIRLARSGGAGVILLHNELWRDSPYLAVLQNVARDEDVSLVDSSLLIATARTSIESEMEKRLELEPRGMTRNRSGQGVKVVFRVYVKTRPAGGVYIVGAHKGLGDLVPNRVVMYDDGTHGDQRAWDNVWSYAATFEPGTRLFYVYTVGGEEGRWTGLDVPWIRSLTVDTDTCEGVIHRPIESFGKVYLLADGWHTDASGYELIAKALVEKLKVESGSQADGPGRRIPELGRAKVPN